jgi:hypothetical protein
VGLRETAENDLAFILEDSVDGFGWDINLTDPVGLSEDLVGYSGDISLTIDPETGVPVSGQLAHVALRITTLKGLGFEIPRGIVETTSKPWVVVFNDIDGVQRTYKVQESNPDLTLGIVICLLENYEP